MHAAACGGSSSTTNLSLVDGLLRLVRSRQLAPPVVAKIKAYRAHLRRGSTRSRRCLRGARAESRAAVLEAGARRMYQILRSHYVKVQVFCTMTQSIFKGNTRKSEFYK